jgi:serine phosphatase RsbU (regulator of sigma subunit)
MLNKLEKLALRIWPGLADLPPDRRVISSLDVLGTFYYAALAGVGILWLAAASDWSRLAGEWPLVVFLLLLLIPINRYSFFSLTELRPGMISSVSSSLDGSVAWAAALILGPVGLWLGVVSVLGRLLVALRREKLGTNRWETWRNELNSLAENTLSRLLALSIYTGLGGGFPFPRMTPQTLGLGLLATLLMFIFQQLISVPLYAYLMAAMARVDPSVRPLRLLGFVVGTGALLAAGTPFAVLAAGLYSEYGLWMAVFFFGGLVVVSYMAHRLSRTGLRSQQQARLMEGLESLSRELLLAPPETDALLERIAEHIRSRNLHLPGRLEIQMFPTRIVVHQPEIWPSPPEAAWAWMRSQPGLHHFKPGGSVPWGEDNSDRCTAMVSILEHDSGHVIGGIYHSLSTRGFIDQDLYQMYLPVLASLADQVALAMRRVTNARQFIAHQRVEQELSLAGDIQGSFLPDKFPEVEGWSLSGALVSARDTSGDYFDFFTVPDGRVGVVVADVADKGVGAALYMALSRAYLRSQALENDPDPAHVVTALNRRVLVDTRSDLFVTLVYALVGPNQNEFVYCNAGHPPPIVVRADASRPVEFLPRTGMVVGVMEETSWETAAISLEPGDYVVIYSDGMTEAINPAGELYGRERLVVEAEGMRGHSPFEIRQHLLESVQAFSGTEQEDDITLLVLVKN